MSGELGCAETYTAIVHWRGGAQPFRSGQINGITGVTWERVLSATADASVTIAKPSMGADCCQLLGAAEPWCHELSIYRDTALVWQGPITQIDETESTVVVSAQDVTAWLAALVNRFPVAATGAIDATQIALNYITSNLNDAVWSVPHDYPKMLAYIVRQDSGSRPTFASRNIVDYVLNIINDLATNYGFDYTTIGRVMFLRDRLTDSAQPQATLTERDFTASPTVTRAGLSAATVGIATTQPENSTDFSQTVNTYWTGTTGTPYGRLDRLARMQAQDATTAELRAAALSMLGGRYPAPLAISSPANSGLNPLAPVTVEQLVPGERIDINIQDYCRPVSQGMRLTGVTGTWGTAGETIAISASPLTVAGGA